MNAECVFKYFKEITVQADEFKITPKDQSLRKQYKVDYEFDAEKNQQLTLSFRLDNNIYLTSEGAESIYIKYYFDSKDELIKILLTYEKNNIKLNKCIEPKKQDLKKEITNFIEISQLDFFKL